MIDQGAQFRGRAPGEVATSDPAQRGEMGLRFAAAEEKIWIPGKAIVPLLAVVDVGSPVGFQDHPFFLDNRLRCRPWASSTRIGVLVRRRKRLKHREIQVDGVGKEDGFMSESLKPVIFRPILQKIFVIQIFEIVETDGAINNEGICSQVAIHLFESRERRADHALSDT